MTAVTLTGGVWKVVSLTGAVIPATEGPNIEFLAEGRIAGHSGCNRFMGSWTQDGTKLEFGQVAGTMMACEPAKMKLEAAMHQALAQARSVAITPGGTLEILGEEGLILRAER